MPKDNLLSCNSILRAQLTLLVISFSRQIHCCFLREETNQLYLDESAFIELQIYNTQVPIHRDKGRQSVVTSIVIMAHTPLLLSSVFIGESAASRPPHCHRRRCSTSAKPIQSLWTRTWPFARSHAASSHRATALSPPSVMLNSNETRYHGHREGSCLARKIGASITQPTLKIKWMSRG